MSFARGTVAFIVIEGKILKGKVTRSNEEVTSVKVRSKSHKVETGSVYTSEIPALREMAKIYRSSRAGYRKQAAALKREVRAFEKAAKVADKQIEKIKTRIAKVSGFQTEASELLVNSVTRGSHCKANVINRSAGVFLEFPQQQSNSKNSSVQLAELFKSLLHMKAIVTVKRLQHAGSKLGVSRAGPHSAHALI